MQNMNGIITRIIDENSTGMGWTGLYFAEIYDLYLGMKEHKREYFEVSLLFQVHNTNMSA